MAELINAKCPNCGAILELPTNLDRAFCIHCGGKVIIAKDVHYHEGKTAIACPECDGRGYSNCEKEDLNVSVSMVITKLIVKSCSGTGKCSGKWLEHNIPTCKNGICTICNGKGKGLLFKCEWCAGTGKCRICHGTGECSYCKGKGKIICEACNGTGFKVYQGE